MLPYCLKCRKNTESKNPKAASQKTGEYLFLKKEEEASGLLSCLEIRTPLSKIPLVGPLSL